jgi:hypothetical protein
LASERPPYDTDRQLIGELVETEFRALIPSANRLDLWKSLVAKDANPVRLKNFADY